MRLVSVLALSAAAVTLTALVSPADAQNRRVYRGQQTERITIIDENGRARTRITVKPRSYLDGGTEVLPGERKFMDYAQAPTYCVARADQLVGSERHASLAAADAVRAAGLFAVFVLVSSAAHAASFSISPMIASPIWAVPTVFVPADAMSAVRRPFASAAAIACSIMSASLIIPNE